jgi:hypothetical protein
LAERAFSPAGHFRTFSDMLTFPGIAELHTSSIVKEHARRKRHADATDGRAHTRADPHSSIGPRPTIVGGRGKFLANDQTRRLQTASRHLLQSQKNPDPIAPPTPLPPKGDAGESKGTRFDCPKSGT